MESPPHAVFHDKYQSYKYEKIQQGNLLTHVSLSALTNSLVRSIVAKKWEPRNPVPSRFSAQIRKVEARLGKLAKIRKVETN